MNLLPADPMAEAGQSNRPSVKGWIAAAAILIAALVLLYVSDTRQANRARDVVNRADLTPEKLTTLNTELAVARYLETSGPHVLAILDEFSQKTKGFLIDEIRFERDGQFAVRATARSAGEINQLASDLSQMQTLASVRIRNQAVKGR
ncbi:unnamed protein product, partial [Ectocarpus fasciculatus]